MNTMSVVPLLILGQCTIKKLYREFTIRRESIQREHPGPEWILTITNTTDIPTHDHNTGRTAKVQSDCEYGQMMICLSEHLVSTNWSVTAVPRLCRRWVRRTNGEHCMVYLLTRLIKYDGLWWNVMWLCPAASLECKYLHEYNIERVSNTTPRAN